MSTPAAVTVLVVDDNQAFRVAAAAVLRRADGFELVGEASDGAAAVEQVAALRPRLVLMDVRMPGVDGIEATRAVLDGWPDTRVILCSTYAFADVPQLAADARVAYVAKEELEPSTLRSLWDTMATTPPAAPPPD